MSKMTSKQRVTGFFFQKKKKYINRIHLEGDEYHYEGNRLSSIRVDCTEEIREITKKRKASSEQSWEKVGCPTKPRSPADTRIIFGVIAP